VGRTFLSACDEVASADPQLKKRRRRLLHWTMPGSTYFITFRTKTGELTPAERTLVLQHLQTGDGKYYSLCSAVIMPDHVHLLITPNEGIELPRIMRGIKGVSARQINDLRGSNGEVWQDECFDRIVRDQNELDEKLNYMLNNPAKRELVDDPWEYEWWYIDQSGAESGGQECPPHR
jgi:REP element-mobilizing transposase RayT